jgi:CheY-like chemotaxis protein
MEKDMCEASTRTESANQARNLFLANMSHEIRTLVHAVLAMADMLAESSLSGEQLRHVSAFKGAGEQLLCLLNELLDFSRIEAGELQLVEVPFHLPQLVQTLCDLMGCQAKSKHLGLHCEIEAGIQPWHLGDPQRLQQVLLNLVSNAIKFTHQGEVTIRLCSTGEDEVLLSVSDTGEGIPADRHKLIFEPFSQGDASVAGRLGGTGLGLAICKRLVQAMDGQINVRSKPGEGSTFSCILKLKVIDESAERTTFTRPDRGAALAKLPKAHILVADDSAMSRMVVEEYLRQTDCRVEIACNGREAVEKISNRSFDMVLMDMRMPVMDGLSATRKIREHEQKQNVDQVPIIALTAGMDNHEREVVLEAGCSDYLAKPVGKEELMRVLLKFLVKHAASNDQELTM